MSNYDPLIHHRKSIRLKGYDYLNPGYYFVTICLKMPSTMLAVLNKRHLELTPAGEIARKYWEEIPMHFPHVGIDTFTVMPNHMHGIVVIKYRYGTSGVIDGTQLPKNQMYTHRLIPPPPDKILTPSTNEAESGVSSDSFRIIAEKNNVNKKMAAISPKSGSLSVILRSYTSSVKRWCNQSGYRQFKWQRGYWEEIIWNERALANIRRYIINNPEKLYEKVKVKMGWVD